MKNILNMCVVTAALLVAPLSTAVSPLPSSTAGSPLPSWTGNATLLGELTAISDWVLTTGVGANLLNKPSLSSCNDSIFINGDLARVLLAASKITAIPSAKRAAYLREGLAWCDVFTALQLPITTATGNSGGYWNTGYDEIFIADTGTAVAALAICRDLQTSETKKKAYTTAMDKYALFVTEGCAKGPTSPAKANASAAGCPASSGGWVRDDGALGDGWYQGMLNTAPYTISTATTGSCAFVELSRLRGGDKSLDKIAADAISWLLDSRSPDGAVPYILSPKGSTNVIFQPITYSTESFIDCDLRYPHLKSKLATLKSTVHFLAKEQNADGSWGNWTSHTESQRTRGGYAVGFSPSGDAERSPRALTLLQWYSARVDSSDAVVNEAIGKFVDFLLDPEKAAAFGVMQDNAPTRGGALVTGFVGLALADLVQPWVTFGPL